MEPIAHFSVEQRRILLGVLFTMFPLGQFFGNPILGSLSDRYGRRPILLISLLLAAPTFLLSSIAIYYNHLILLFISRFLGGLFEGNVVIAQSSLSDLSSDASAKKKRFGWILSVSSVGFLFGPFLGSYLSDNSIAAYFSMATPFVAAFLLFLLSFMTILLFFKETLPEESRSRDYAASLGAIVISLKEMVSRKNLQKVYFSNFLTFLGVFFFLNFYSALLVTRFHFNIKAIAGASAFLSICFMIAPSLNALIFKRVSARKTLQITCCCLALALSFFISTSQVIIVFLTLLPVGIFLSTCFAYPPLLISESVDKTIQGKALGANMSLQMLSEALTALIGGFLMAVTPSLVVVTSITFLLLGALAYRTLKSSLQADL